MIARVERWIVSRIALGRFAHLRDVVAFAVTRSMWTTVAALFLNFVVYEVFGSIGLFGISIPSNPVGDMIVTGFVAGPISFLAYYFIGSAILDLAISRKEFEVLSHTDPLTGLMNRRAVAEVMRGSEQTFALAILDIDRFKTINDTYGHDAGDLVLQRFSQMLQEGFGKEDSVARLGGEEFGVILRGKTKQETIALVDRFRAEVAAHRFAVGSQTIPVTVSAGVSPVDGNLTYSTLLTIADRALFIAKASGRNRVVHADEIGVMFKDAEGVNEKIAV